MSPPEFEALPQAERERLQKAMQQLQDKLVHVLRESMRLRKEHADRLRALNRSTTQLAVDHGSTRPRRVMPICRRWPPTWRRCAPRSSTTPMPSARTRTATPMPWPRSKASLPATRSTWWSMQAAVTVRPIVDADLPTLPEPGRPRRPHRALRHARHRLPPHQGRAAAPRQWRLPAGRHHEAADAAIRLGRAEARAAATRDPHRVDGRDVQHGVDRPARATADPAGREGGAGRRAPASASCCRPTIRSSTSCSAWSPTWTTTCRARPARSGRWRGRWPRRCATRRCCRRAQRRWRD